MMDRDRIEIFLETNTYKDCSSKFRSKTVLIQYWVYYEIYLNSLYIKKKKGIEKKDWKKVQIEKGDNLIKV
jgi:hypothetical protein